MRGLHFDGSSVRFRCDLPLPEPGRGEARVRVRLAGVCNTDLEIIKGYLPFKGVLGHEFVGVVDAAPGREDVLGARVVGEINAACGNCGACRRGMPRHCPSRTVLGIAGRDGCLADFCLLPVENLHRVPDGVSDEAAVFTEPLAAAFRIPEQLALRGDERVLVLGDGKLGLLCAMVLRPRVGDLVVAGRHDGKLAIARAAGARAVLIPPGGIAAEADLHQDRSALGQASRPALYAGWLGGWEARQRRTVVIGGFDVVVEATGSGGGLREALARVRPLGTVVLKSTVAGETTAPLSSAVVNEVTIVGSRCGPFEPALQALAEGSIDPRPLVAARYPLECAEEAVKRAAEPGALKVLVDVSQVNHVHHAHEV